MVTRLKGLLRIYQNTSSRLVGPSFVVSKSKFGNLDGYRSLSSCSRTRIDDTFVKGKGRNLTIASVLATITTITYIEETRTKGTLFSACEKKEDGQPAIEEKDKAKSEKQPDTDVDEDEDEDEPTTCTICLINRQGPCRPYWRKFERCMKENSSKDDDGEEGKESSSMSEKCDVHMMPWIKCIQQFRNRYTNISNAYFQKEMIDKVEDTFEEDEKVLLDIKDLSTIVEIGSDWKKVVAGRSNDDIEQQKDKNDENINVDDVLVEGVARINLWDSKGERQVELAYIKDQDGLLLGYDQFSYLKKNSGSGDENNNDNGDNNEQQSKSVIGKVGECNFHVNPETTKSIQIFALYRSDIPKTSVEDKDSDVPKTEAPAEAKSTSKVMFYSSLIPMDKVKVQDIVEAPVVDDSDKEQSRETDESKSS